MTTKWEPRCAGVALRRRTMTTMRMRPRCRSRIGCDPYGVEHIRRVRVGEQALRPPLLSPADAPSLRSSARIACGADTGEEVSHETSRHQPPNIAHR